MYPVCTNHRWCRNRYYTECYTRLSEKLVKRHVKRRFTQMHLKCEYRGTTWCQEEIPPETKERVKKKVRERRREGDRAKEKERKSYIQIHKATHRFNWQNLGIARIWTIAEQLWTLFLPLSDRWLKGSFSLANMLPQNKFLHLAISF